MASLVTIEISKDEILNVDVSRVREILDSFIPNLFDRNRNGVAITVSGYNTDSRELFQINEVRKWYNHLFEVVPELFFWMDMRPPWFTFYAIMFGTPIRVNGGTTVSSEDLERFLLWGFQNLNLFCVTYSLKPDLSNEHIHNATIGELGNKL